MNYTVELDKLYSKQSFKDGNRYFHFANYPELFKFIDEKERKTYDQSFPDEFLVAVCLSYDLDDYFHLVFNEKKSAYYIRNGLSSSTPKSIGGATRLLKPIKIAKSLYEMFGTQYFENLLVSFNNAEYNLYRETQFHGGFERLNDTLPKVIIPNEDLRLYVRNTCPDFYITHPEEYNVRNFTEFLTNKSIDKYIDTENFLSRKLHSKDFVNAFNNINKALGKERFLFIEFLPSGFYAIVDTDDLNKTDLSKYLKYGLIYNKIDISEEIYDLLK